MEKVKRKKKRGKLRIRAEKHTEILLRESVSGAESQFVTPTAGEVGEVTDRREMD